MRQLPLCSSATPISAKSAMVSPPKTNPINRIPLSAATFHSTLMVEREGNYGPFTGSISVLGQPAGAF